MSDLIAWPSKYWDEIRMIFEWKNDNKKGFPTISRFKRVI